MAPLEGNADLILAADFGGTRIKIAIVRQRVIVCRSSFEARAELSLKNRLDVVADEWERLLNSQSAGLRDCLGVALALPFLKDASGRRVVGSFGKFPGAEEVDLPAWTQDRLGLPVEFENDLRMALLGEWTAGAACGKSDVVMISLGTGIGCAVMSGGRLLRGFANRAGTLFGHTTIDSGSIPGRCGNLGCAVDQASTATLDQLARAHPDFSRSRLNLAPRIDYKLVFEHARQGDACAAALLSQSLKIWSTVVQNAILAYDPELVVIGGGIAQGADILLPAIEQHLGRYMPAPSTPAPVVVATLGDDAALVGGAAVLQQKSIW